MQTGLFVAVKLCDVSDIENGELALAHEATALQILRRPAAKHSDRKNSMTSHRRVPDVIFYGQPGTHDNC